MYRRLLPVLAVVALSGMPRTRLTADDSPNIRRRHEAQEFHIRAQERTGLLVPMYVYPRDIHKNSAYNRLMDLKHRYETFHVGHPQPRIGPWEKCGCKLYQGD